MAVSIRTAEYRNQEGFMVVGRPKVNAGVFPVKIFTKTRSSAEHIKAKVNRGERIDLADFNA